MRLRTKKKVPYQSDIESMVKIMEDIYAFIKKVNDDGEPLIAKICTIDTGQKNKVFINLWAGFDEDTPISRIEVLRKQNAELKRLLTIAMTGNISDEDKYLMEMSLRIFS